MPAKDPNKHAVGKEFSESRDAERYSAVIEAAVALAHVSKEDVEFAIQCCVAQERSFDYFLPLLSAVNNKAARQTRGPG